MVISCCFIHTLIATRFTAVTVATDATADSSFCSNSKEDILTHSTDSTDFTNEVLETAATNEIKDNYNSLDFQKSM